MPPRRLGERAGRRDGAGAPPNPAGDDLDLFDAPEPGAPAPPGEPAAGGLDDLLADEAVWAEEPRAPRPGPAPRPAPGPAPRPAPDGGPDGGLDDILGLDGIPPGGVARPGDDDFGDPAPELDPGELDDVLLAAFDPDPPRPGASPDGPAAAPLRADGGPVALGPAPRLDAPPLDAPRPEAPRADASRAPPRGMDELDRLLGMGAARPTRARRLRAVAAWAAVLVVLVAVALLPYPFEVGGEFVIQPLERAEARSRTDGEITAIRVAEGDWVEAGAVMAVLSNWDERRDVAVNAASLAKLQADLNTLLDGPKPEQVEVARQSVATAELRVAATTAALERQRALFGTGAIAEAELEDAQNLDAVARSNLEEARAQLALASAEPRPSEVSSLNAQVERAQEELAFSRLMLEYTNIRAPVAGQVVSSLDDVPVGAALPAGGLFAEIEDNSTVIAEVEVPETTIDEVAVGAPAELRLWSDPDRPITGTVRSIAPRAEERDFGWIIRVQVEVPNPDGALAANMTGFGKISAAERPVWQAFGRAIQRFFVIELWSWLP